LLTDAMRLRLRADGPIAASLSGSFDAMFSAALAGRLCQAPLTTFSVALDDAGSEDGTWDVERLSRGSSDHGVLRGGAADIGMAFPEVVRHAETPLLRAEPALAYLASRFVRDRGCSVVVSGTGAEEMFA